MGPTTEGAGRQVGLGGTSNAARWLEKAGNVIVSALQVSIPQAFGVSTPCPAPIIQSRRKSPRPVRNAAPKCGSSARNRRPARPPSSGCSLNAPVDTPPAVCRPSRRSRGEGLASRGISVTLSARRHSRRSLRTLGCDALSLEGRRPFILRGSPGSRPGSHLRVTDRFPLARSGGQEPAPVLPGP
jgi:hypothetical protein